jgi:hypothetical protein
MCWVSKSEKEGEKPKVKHEHLILRKSTQHNVRKRLSLTKLCIAANDAGAIHTSKTTWSFVAISERGLARFSWKKKDKKAFSLCCFVTSTSNSLLRKQQLSATARRSVRRPVTG